MPIRDRYRHLLDLLTTVDKAELRIDRIDWRARDGAGLPAEVRLIVRGTRADGARCQLEQRARVAIATRDGDWKITREDIVARTLVARAAPRFADATDEAGIRNRRRLNGHVRGRRSTPGQRARLLPEHRAAQPERPGAELSPPEQRRRYVHRRRVGERRGSRRGRPRSLRRGPRRRRPCRSRDPEYRQPAVVLHNVGPARHRVELQLVGVRSNRDAVGVRVRVQTPAGWEMRAVHAGSGYLSGHSLVQHFGLGDATAATIVEISWPSGAQTTLHDVAADRRYRIVEGEGGVVALR